VRVKQHPKSIVSVKSKFQIVIPQKVRERIGVEVGDVLEATAERGRIVLRPKVIVDRDEYTPAQRRRIDAQLAKSISEDKQGRSFGPFRSHQEMVDFLHQQRKSSGKKRGERSKARSR